MTGNLHEIFEFLDSFKTKNSEILINSMFDKIDLSPDDKVILDSIRELLMDSNMIQDTIYGFKWNNIMSTIHSDLDVSMKIFISLLDNNSNKLELLKIIIPKINEFKTKYFAELMTKYMLNTNIVNNLQKDYLADISQIRKQVDCALNNPLNLTWKSEFDILISEYQVLCSSLIDNSKIFENRNNRQNDIIKMLREELNDEIKLYRIFSQPFSFNELSFWDKTFLLEKFTQYFPNLKKYMKFYNFHQESISDITLDLSKKLEDFVYFSNGMKDFQDMYMFSINHIEALLLFRVLSEKLTDVELEKSIIKFYMKLDAIQSDFTVEVNKYDSLIVEDIISMQSLNENEKEKILNYLCYSVLFDKKQKRFLIDLIEEQNHPIDLTDRQFEIIKELQHEYKINFNDKQKILLKTIISKAKQNCDEDKIELFKSVLGVLEEIIVRDKNIYNYFNYKQVIALSYILNNLNPLDSKKI